MNKIGVMSNKGFLHLYSFTLHKYYVLAVGAVSYGDYVNYFSGAFFHPARTIFAQKKNSYN